MRFLKAASFFVFTWAIAWTFPTPAVAQPSGIGIGAQMAASNTGGRAPVGLSLKSWINERQAVTGATSFLVGDDEFDSPLSFWILEGNYLFHNFQTVTVENGDLGLYVGGGAQFMINEASDNDLAFRAPLGINYIFEDAPADVFVEIAPTLQITDPTLLRFDGAIGFRYFLGRVEE
jgi:hypothetical protein